MLKILEKYETPTGHIVVAEDESGRKLEFLSLGDYGQQANIKADFLGLTDEVKGVKHQRMLPLEDKWVVTISTQFGCSMGCAFCDVPKVGPGVNVPKELLVDQVMKAIDIHPEVEHTKRLNLHYARMGEPTFNVGVLKATYRLADELKSKRGWGFHPVVSTMMPSLLPKDRLMAFVDEWLTIKNDLLEGEAGFQLSINSTSAAQRTRMFNGSACYIDSIASIMESAIARNGGIKGRKIALNFALTPDSIVDPDALAGLFDPEHFMVKITPMHITNAVLNADMYDPDMYSEYTPYSDTEAALKRVGFDVLVFVPSIEEDLGRITCGNAILSGTKPLLKEQVIDG